MKATLVLQCCRAKMQVLNIHSGVWRQHNQFIVVSLLFNADYWMVAIGEAHAHTVHAYTRVHRCTSVWCVVLRLSERVYFPLIAHGRPQCLYESCMRGCVRGGCVWECEFPICRSSDLAALDLHMHTIWLTATPYLSCWASLHAPMHPCTHIHALSHVHILICSHTEKALWCSQGEMMKGNSETHSQLKTLWKSVFFSPTCAATVAGCRPSRLFPAYLVDFVYGQTASVGPVVQVKVSICLHWLVSHMLWLCTEAMGHNQLQLRSFRCCNNMSVCIITIHWA